MRGTITGRILDADFASTERRILEHYCAGDVALTMKLHDALTPQVPWYVRLMTWFRQLICRHSERLLHFEGRRMTLRCSSCGHDTPGWDTSKR